MEFKEQQLKNILEINPRMTLKKGTVTKKIAMEHLTEYVKQVKGYELSEFKSGSKFKNKDTLVARITPCLENGKTAYVDILADDEVAFGSTEFFVVRAKENKGDPQFIYYLMRHPKVRDATIKSMTGTSGRQRAQKEAILEYSMSLPNIFDQKKIGYFLSLFDSKIEANNDTIHNLEQISQILFKHWFIDFEFPNEEGKPYKSSGGEMLESELGNIPKNWTLSYFSNYVKHTVGGDWGKENVEKNYVEQVSIIRGADIPELIKGTDNKVPTRFILKKNYENKKLLSGDIVIEISGGSPTQSTGRSIFINKNIISRYNDKVLCTNFCRIIRPVDFNKGIWLQIYINYLYKKNVFFNFENGTTGIKNLDLNAVLNKYKIFSPSEDIIHLFSERMKVILDSIQNLGMENKRLANLRDTLLPKLLSGEIEIPDELEV